jgi:energy-coupling factor transporter transmembrane protein EcfT
LASAPFIAFFGLISFVLGGFEKTLTVIALICIGCLLYGIQPEEFSYALMFFRIPPKLAHSIAIAMRMFQILIGDFRLTSEALKVSGIKGLGYYVKLLKAFSAVTVLRAFAMAETLYSRRFDFDRRIVRCRKPKPKDWILLALSTLIFCYTYLIRNVL